MNSLRVNHTPNSFFISEKRMRDILSEFLGRILTANGGWGPFMESLRREDFTRGLGEVELRVQIPRRVGGAVNVE